MADFQLALCHIVPSMYRGLEGMVELNTVDWKDIGGLQDVKQALKQVGCALVMLNDISLSSQCLLYYFVGAYCDFKMLSSDATSIQKNFKQKTEFRRQQADIILICH